MGRPTKHVTRLDLWINPVFGERLGREADITLEVAPLAGSDAEILAALGRAHVYHISPARNELPVKWQANDALLDRLPGLLAVSSAAAGFDTVDVEACTRHGVLVVCQIGGNAQSVAEHAIGLMLAVRHKIAYSDRLLRTTRGYSREDLMGTEISGKTVGIVGLGNTGRRTAAIAHGFGMTVLACDPFLTEAEVAERGAKKVDLRTLLESVDIVSLNCPLDKTTRGMIGADAFARMRKGAIIVSTARGGVLDEAALYAALKSGHLAGAGLDVWETEPPPLDHPLLTLDTVVATHHTAGVAHEARFNVAEWGAEQIVQLLRGEKPPRLVNPEVWPTFEKRYAQIFGTGRG